jgi:hypothetical protein
MQMMPHVKITHRDELIARESDCIVVVVAISSPCIFENCCRFIIGGTAVRVPQVREAYWYYL